MTGFALQLLRPPGSVPLRRSGSAAGEVSSSAERARDSTAHSARMELPSLILEQPPVVCAPNPGPDTLIQATSRRQPILVSPPSPPPPLGTSASGMNPRVPDCGIHLASQISAAGSCVNILDRQGGLQQSLPFELAFPVHDLLARQLVQAVAFDPSTSRVSRGRKA